MQTLRCGAPLKWAEVNRKWIVDTKTMDNGRFAVKGRKEMRQYTWGEVGSRGCSFIVGLS